MSCAACLKDILDENYVACTISSCNNIFHTGVCIGGNGPVDAETWICPCRCTMKKASDYTLSPIRSFYNSPETSQNVTFRNNNNKKELTALLSEIRLLRSDVCEIKDQMSSMNISLNQCNERLDEMMMHIEHSDKRLKALEDREIENAALRSQVSLLQEQLSINNQASLRNEIEIMGIPEVPGENLCHVLRLAATKAGAELLDNEIDWISRVGTKQLSKLDNSEKQTPLLRGRPIVIRLVSRNKRDDLMKRWKSRKISSKDLEIDGKEQKVYFNDRLTKENRILFRDVRQRAAQSGYRYCWTNRGSIFVRKQEGSSAIQIRSPAEMAEKLGAFVNGSYGGNGSN